MPDIRYRRGSLYAADMAAYSRLMAEDNSRELRTVRNNLAQALREEVTARQRKILLMYYAEGLNMKQIGDCLGVDRSTVSRTIKRGETRLRRCLRYGAAAFLADDD